MERVDFKAYGAAFAHVYDRMVPPVASLSSVESCIADALGSSEQATVIELGVGTGRVAIPLAATLRKRLHGSVTYIGVDGSREMLQKLGERDSRCHVSHALADITDQDQVRSVVGTHSADAVLCVGGTFPQIQSRADQRAAFANAAELLGPGGRFIVECHNPSAIRSMVSSTSGSLTIRYPAHSTALVWFTSIDEATDLWEIEEVWVEGELATWLRETTLLTPIETLDSYAHQSGLRRIGLTGALGSETEYSERSMMYTATYERSQA